MTQTAVQTLSALCRTPYEPARTFKASGGKVIGYLSPHAPVEVIEALGMMAVRLDGGGVAETPSADAFMESRFDPTVRGVCEQVMTAHLDFLDALLVTRGPDSVQRLYYYLSEQQRIGAARIPQLIFYDLLHSPFDTSSAYSSESLNRVVDELAALAGRPLQQQALKGAVDASNRRREALQRCLSGRQSRPVRLSGVQALHLLWAASRMRSDEFVALADAVHAELTDVRHDSAVRVMLAGNAPDVDDLHAALERMGAVVVGDYHDRGELAFGEAIDASGGLLAISEHYQRRVRGARSFSDPQHLAMFARAQGADCALFYYYAQEEVLAWDYPGQRDALAEAGLVSCCLTDQPYQFSASDFEGRVAPFLAQVKRGLAR